jgi:hypothetical protein
MDQNKIVEGFLVPSTPPVSTAMAVPASPITSMQAATQEFFEGAAKKAIVITDAFKNGEQTLEQTVLDLIARSEKILFGQQLARLENGYIWWWLGDSKVWQQPGIYTLEAWIELQISQKLAKGYETQLNWDEIKMDMRFYELYQEAQSVGLPAEIFLVRTSLTNRRLARLQERIFKHKHDVDEIEEKEKNEEKKLLKLTEKHEKAEQEIQDILLLPESLLKHKNAQEAHANEPTYLPMSPIKVQIVNNQFKFTVETYLPMTKESLIAFKANRFTRTLFMPGRMEEPMTQEDFIRFCEKEGLLLEPMPLPEE